MGARTTVRLLGSAERQTAFSVSNAAWRDGLMAAGIHVVDDGIADVLIHHDYSQRFGDVELPDAGRKIAVRPWDLGPYPSRWAQIVEEQYDELWVFTEWGRECAIAGGIAPEIVRVVPLGVDMSVHTPDGDPHELVRRAKVTFLFVGAAVHRKGIDIALEAFVQAFDADDDVQLIIKDHTRDIFYKGLSHQPEIARAAERPGGPTIVYIDDYMPRSELAAMYRGADALVAPSRAEGWALPVVEAMASGTPVIVPEFGAFLTHCSGDGAMLVPTKHIRVPARGYFTTNTLGYEEYVDRVDFCETLPATLAETMRTFAAEPDATRQRRSVAARANAGRFTWAASTAAVIQAISA
jgi:glycosyltransferase involved in cell wall biosynthesis